MKAPQKLMGVITQADEVKPHQRGFGQVEPFFLIGLEKINQLCFLRFSIKIAPILFDQGQLHFFMHHLQHLGQFFPNEGSAQGIVTLHHGLPGFLENCLVYFTLQLAGELFKVGTAIGIENGMEQHTLLHW